MRVLAAAACVAVLIAAGIGIASQFRENEQVETDTPAPAAGSSVSETTATTTAFTAAAHAPEGIAGERDEAHAAIPTTAPANAQFYDEWQEISEAHAAIPTTTAGVIRIAPPREEVVCNAAADCYTRSEKTATTTTFAPTTTTLAPRSVNDWINELADWLSNDDCCYTVLRAHLEYSHSYLLSGQPVTVEMGLRIAHQLMWLENFEEDMRETIRESDARLEKMRREFCENIWGENTSEEKRCIEQGGQRHSPP